MALQTTANRVNSIYRSWGRSEGSQTLFFSCFWVKHIGFLSGWRTWGLLLLIRPRSNVNMSCCSAGSLLAITEEP